MSISQQELKEQVSKALGQIFSAQDFTSCLKEIQVLEPVTGKYLWERGKAPVGLWVILKSKARVLDAADNLLISLQAGTALGEFTLFPEENFQPYAVRASQNLLIGFLNQQCLRSLTQRYPQIRERLREQALVRDLLLLCAQRSQFRDIPRSDLLKLIPQMQRHPLAVGTLPNSLLKDQHLWLLRQGELLHTSGRKLLPGCPYTPAQPAETGSWQVTRPTELYSLSQSVSETLQSATTPSDQFGPSLSQPIQAKAGNIPIAHAPAVASVSRPLAPPFNSRSPYDKKVGNAYFPGPTIQMGHWWQGLTRQYPFLKQQSARDCGVACLVMIGRYWGKRLSVNQLRNVANVDRRGASLRGLITASESIGFTARPVKGTLAGLAQQQLPAIVHWQGNHYVVVYGVTRNRVFVADPAIGRLPLSHAKFKEGWTGYTLLLQPTAQLKQSPEAKQDLWSFFELVKPHWFMLLEVLLASVMIQVFGLCTPLFTQLLLDRVIVQRSSSSLLAIGSGLLIFNVFSILMTSLRRYLLFHTANRIDLSLAIGFIAHAFRLPLHYFDTRYVGDITSRVQENRTIRKFLSGDAILTSLDILTVVVYLGLMFWYSRQLTFMAIVILPLLAFVTLVSTPFLKRVSREIFSAKTLEGNYLIEALTGISTVKALGIEHLARWHWEDLFNKSLKTSFSGQLIRERLTLMSSFIETIGTKLLFLFGVWQVIDDQLTIGQLVAFNMLLGNVFSPFQRLISLWNDFQEVLIAVERINDVLESNPEEDVQVSSLLSLPPIQGHICFENVTFRYNPGSKTNTLENLSFEVLPGQMIAIVGRSGSGKTTLAKLILGLYPVTSGRILIDGHDISSTAKRSLRRQIGVVDQDTFLFGGTIRENISIAHPNATLEEIREAARQSGAEQFINELPMKYDTQIGEGGGMLSGGQRQRLAIARALLGNPCLLILDEATSNLDAESERIIQTMLNTILKNRTTLVIAHRLSTVRNADLILVLDRGVLVEQGTHAELMTKRGQYFYLNQQQLATTA
jgi:ATP-binding cassette subfamily B protein